MVFPTSVVRSEQSCALGAAICAAAAAGRPFGEAMAAMASGVEKSYVPDPVNRERCEALYRRYLSMADWVEKLAHPQK